MTEEANSNSYLLSNSSSSKKQTINRYSDGDFKERKYSKLTMNYDKILEHLGELGPWQLFNVALLWLPPIASGVFTLTWSFTGLEPSKGFRCFVPSCDNAQPEYCSVPPAWIHPTDDNGDWDYCHQFPLKEGLENSSMPCGDPNNFNTTKSFSLDQCSKIVYNDFEFESTVITQNNLVCGEQYKVGLVGSLYMAGMFFGSFIFGYLGDRLGRKITLMISILTVSSVGLAGAFCGDSFIAYAALRFLTAVCAQGLFLAPFSHSTELVGTKWKTIVGNLVQVPFALGEALVGLVAVGIRDWKTLQIVLSVPVYGLLVLYFILPESPRWLIAKGRYKEARAVIEKAARWNKAKIPSQLLEIPSQEEGLEGTSKKVSDPQPTLGISDMFKNPLTRKVTIVMFLNWTIVTLSYYGISMASTKIGSDIFTSYILTALIEIPSYIFNLLVMDRWGRKPIFASAFILTGVTAVPAAFLEEGTLRTILALAGKFGAASAFAIAFMYTAELYPTVLRSTAVGMCSMMARLGGIAAPQAALYVPEATGLDWLPMVIMGGSAFIGGVLALTLPETLGAQLPETMEDLSFLENNKKSFFSCWSPSKLSRKSTEMQVKKENWKSSKV